MDEFESKDQNSWYIKSQELQKLLQNVQEENQSLIAEQGKIISQNKELQSKSTNLEYQLSVKDKELDHIKQDLSTVMLDLNQLEIKYAEVTKAPAVSSQQMLEQSFSQMPRVQDNTPHKSESQHPAQQLPLHDDIRLSPVQENNI